MIDGVMKYLDYLDPPAIQSYKSPVCREYLRKVSNYSCVYCTISESEASGATFHVDHFRPQSKFPHLIDEISNLRYACPRCNLIKGNHWIKREDGCIRDCEKCDAKHCHENVYRLIDCCFEKPQEHIKLNESGMLEEVGGSKPGIHTIKYLRLNRAQLVRLRLTRRYIDLWRQELENKRVAIIERMAYIKKEKQRFEEIVKAKKFVCKSELTKQLQDVITTLFAMLSEETDYSLKLVDLEIEKVNTLLQIRVEPDDSVPTVDAI